MKTDPLHLFAYFDNFEYQSAIIDCDILSCFPDRVYVANCLIKKLKKQGSFNFCSGILNCD